MAIATEPDGTEIIYLACPACRYHCYFKKEAPRYDCPACGTPCIEPDIVTAQIVAEAMNHG